MSGATTAEARLPTVDSFTCGSTSRLVLVERSGRRPGFWQSLVQVKVILLHFRPQKRFWWQELLGHTIKLRDLGDYVPDHGSIGVMMDGVGDRSRTDVPAVDARSEHVDVAACDRPQHCVRLRLPTVRRATTSHTRPYSCAALSSLCNVALHSLKNTCQRRCSGDAHRILSLLLERK